ncbi:MAG TPA: hypothetical protein VIK33_10820 [Anaerolineae bacterium]
MSKPTAYQDALFPDLTAEFPSTRYQGSSDGIPSESELASLLKRYKRHVRVEHFGQYKYVLSTNSESSEILLIGA